MKRKNKEPPNKRDESPENDKIHAARKGDLPKMILIPLGIILGFVLSSYYNSFQSGQVNTPLNVDRVVDSSSYTSQKNLDRYWGTYRSNLYFGLKTRSENPLNVGMMWFNQFNNKFQIRHGCDQGDGLSKYGWTTHDGRNFGIHDIYESSDNRFQIRNSWVKRLGGSHGGDWTVRTTVEKFSGDQSPPKFVSVIFYVAQNYTGWIKNIERSKGERIVSGETSDLGRFKVKLSLGDAKKEVYSDAVTGTADISVLKDVLINNQYFKRKSTNSETIREYIALKGISSADVDSSNFIAFQVSALVPFEFDLIFESESASNEYESRTGARPTELKGTEFDTTLAKWNAEFQNKFERIFKLKEKKYEENAINAAQATMSNLIGGIGFFTGQSIVKSMYSSEPVLYWQSNLYTAVPSRSFFPRGFLWDEGFHNLLISQWDPEVTKDIISHWLDLMNVEGWIPREVILGEEAQAKVPQEFWIQNNEFANPPTLFIPLLEFVKKVTLTKGSSKTEQSDLEFLNKIYPRLKKWYHWFNTTQVGKEPFTFRWRGRNQNTPLELNAKTLTSGLDDYPRASHPTDQERHLDLRCWMTLASNVIGKIAELTNNLNDKQKYLEYYSLLSNNDLLNSLHWSGSQYADFGLHSNNIRLVRPSPKQEMNRPPQQQQMVRQVDTEPKYDYINSIGYVSLFPLLLEIIDSDSPNLDVVLDQIKNPNFWTKYGLRSLAKNAPLYAKRNTEHDPPYWRGAIWININYLALKSLKHYSSIDGPYREKATKIYNELRESVVKNILDNYQRTGYIWEQYNDITGKGQGSHPFTGWSSLFVLMMAEIY